jgi:hypothetical protein
LKWNRTETRSSTNSPRKFCLSLVTSDQKEGDEHSTCINETDPPFQDFVGPTDFDNVHGHHGRDSGDIIIESRKSRAPIQEGSL